MSNVYIKISGVAGDVTQKGYTGWILINSAHLNIKRHMNSETGRKSNRLSGHPVFSQVKITKYTDTSSNKILQLVCQATVIEQVTIHICDTDDNAYEMIELHNVYIAEYDKNINLGSDPAESFYLDYSKIIHTVAPRNALNKTSSRLSGGYDLERAVWL